MATAPRPDSLTGGALRELVPALHELHRAAGKPGVRRISIAIRDSDDPRDTVSQETISAHAPRQWAAEVDQGRVRGSRPAAWSVTGLGADREARRPFGHTKCAVRPLRASAILTT